MSQRSVEQALGKLVTDEGFRRAFFNDPARASHRVGLHLSPEELDALARIPRSALAGLSRWLDDRICRLDVCAEPQAGEQAR